MSVQIGSLRKPEINRPFLTLSGLPGVYILGIFLALSRNINNCVISQNFCKKENIQMWKFYVKPSRINLEPQNPLLVTLSNKLKPNYDFCLKNLFSFAMQVSILFGTVCTVWKKREILSYRKNSS